MQNLTKILLGVLLLFTAACGSGKKSGEQAEGDQDKSMDSKDTASMKSKVSMNPAPSSPAYDNAMLELTKPKKNATFSSGDSVSFAFNVKNYKLKEQTSDYKEKDLAYSSKGQHIHLILNNGPYDARYSPEFKKSLDDGHYVALAFLARSYHESVKNPNAFVLRQFKVGKANKEKVDLTQPMLFYSRPKGTYVGKDAKKLLFDFYPVNTEISKDSMRVKVTVNDKHKFTVTKWEAKVIEGLPMGKNTIKIELIDQDGNPVDGPFTSETREITLKKASAS